MDPAEYSIRKRIIQGEGKHLDFKFAINDSKKIARSMSAFANAEGGSLLLGVKDNGKIAGIRSEEEYFMAETAAHVFCKPAIAFESVLWNLDGKEILEIVVSPSETELISAPSDDGTYRYFYRQADQNHVVSTLFVEVWNRRKASEEIVIDDMDRLRERMNCFSEHKILDSKQFAMHSKLSEEEAHKSLVELLLLGFLDFFYTEKGEFYIKTD